MKLTNAQMALIMLFIQIVISLYMWTTGLVKTNIIVYHSIDQTIEFRFHILSIIYKLSLVLFIGFLFRSFRLPRFYVKTDTYPQWD